MLLPNSHINYFGINLFAFYLLGLWISLFFFVHWLVGWLAGSPVRFCSSLGLELGLHRIYCLCAQYTVHRTHAVRILLWQVPWAFAIHSKIQANYYHLLTPKITNLYRSIFADSLLGWLVCWLAGWLYILWHFLWANKVCLTLPFPFSLFPEIVVHIQRQPWHILIRSTLCLSPTATISTVSFHRFFICTIFFFTSFNFGTRKCSFCIFFFRSPHFVLLPDRSFALATKSDPLFALSASSKCNFNGAKKKREYRERINQLRLKYTLSPFKLQHCAPTDLFEWMASKWL